MKSNRFIKYISFSIVLYLVFSCQSSAPDSKNTPIKGFMIDAARCVENMEHYYRTVDFCADLYKYTPNNKYHGEDIEARRFYPWRNKEDLEYVFAKKDIFKNEFVETVRLLKNQSKNVNTNKKDFDEFLLSVEYLKHIVWRENVLFDFKDDTTNMSEKLKEIAEADEKMLSQLNVVWESGRKGEMNKRHIWEFPIAAAYSKKTYKR